MTETVRHVLETASVREEIQSGPNLYGREVGDRIVEFLSERRGAVPFGWAADRVGFETADADFDYL